jgi:hypothetical protein
MKRMLIIALAACFMLAMGTSLAFADSYDVTADYGKRVTEQGTCEEVGAITITPEVGGDSFYANQVVTMELLGGLEVCYGFYAVYDMVALPGADVYNAAASAAFTPPGADQFAVQGVFMNDFVTITFGTSLTPALALEPIVYGHDAPTQLCVDLSGTLYTASDPLYQTLKATYSSSPGSHTFSGDLEIATVKSRTVVFANCTKTEGTTMSANGYSSMDYKDSVPQIELCYGSYMIGQDQVITDCGEDSAYEEICFRVTDTATGAFVSGQPYQFTVGKTTGAKACVGISYVEVRMPSGAIVPQTAPAERRNSANVLGAWAAIDTTQMKVFFDGQGPGTYYVVMGLVYDTCCATPGPYVINFSGGQIPCGGSFGFIDQTVANFVECLSTIEFSRVIPYGAETATSGWMNGIVFTNPNNFQITINCAIYEEDGDAYTGTVVVGPMGMVVGLDTAVLMPVAVGADATFGDESYAIYATGNGIFHVFMINFDLVQAQGYLAPIDILNMGGF